MRNWIIVGAAIPMKRLAKKSLGKLRHTLVRKNRGSEFFDIASDDMEVIRVVESYTMTSPERLYALIQAVRYIEGNGIPGDIVECGVWKGGSMMLVAKVLMSLGNMNRNLWLFDTYTGMPRPGEVDVSPTEGGALDLFSAKQTGNNTSNWCYAPLAEVQKAMYGTGYATSKIHFVQGLVEDTIPREAPARLAILRLDTDWYSSTRHELVHLFPRLSKGGVLIVDDYGHWMGARMATDEYFTEHRLHLLLTRVDSTGRIGVKN